MTFPSWSTVAMPELEDVQMILLEVGSGVVLAVSFAVEPRATVKEEGRLIFWA